MTARKCTATVREGEGRRPCRAWAVPGSEPPRCAAHGGGGRRGGASKGSGNVERHGWYARSGPGSGAKLRASSGFYAADPAEITIDQAIAGLVDKMARLDEVIAALDGDGEYLIRLFELYTMASSRLSRMLRDRRALSGEASDGFAGAIAQALDELGSELGVDLSG